MKKLKRNAKGQSVKLRRCYVYEIRVDGVVRYIGKGCNDRIYSHLIEAKRTASKPGVKIRNLGPHFRKMLVSAADSGEGGQAFHLKADSESGRWRTAFR